MARFERSRERKGRSGSGDRSRGSGGSEDRPRRDSRDNRRGFEDRPRRDFKRFSRNRRDLEFTKVTCASCGKECEVPFKPKTDKPVYCRDCFDKPGKGSTSSKPSSKELDVINKKLDKIMKALKIE